MSEGRLGSRNEEAGTVESRQACVRPETFTKVSQAEVDAGSGTG